MEEGAADVVPNEEGGEAELAPNGFAPPSKWNADPVEAEVEAEDAPVEEEEEMGMLPMPAREVSAVFGS